MAKESPTPGAHQFYITHCARSDSVLNTVGFSVRAASTGSNDPELLKLAMEYPAYELPMEMWAKKPNRSLAPRRLARVRTPRGVMVVHTSYLEKDTMNRDRSYFSHVVLLPSVPPIDVLQSWNGDHWETDYQPGETKDLPTPAEPLTAGAAFSREAVVKFLACPDMGPVDSLAVGCWNETLRQNQALRRDLVGRVMHGILRAAQDPVRNRLYIHAEPGVVAALIHAAALLLPPPVVGDLTFTTFEPAHRGLKEFKRALVVGTYLAQPNRGLDAELVHQRGYVVDCFSPDRGSPQLLGPLPAGIERLVDMAAEGQWTVIETVHSFCGNRVKAPDDLERSVTLTAAIDRLKQGVPSTADLILIQQDEMGREFLESDNDNLWPKILDLALKDSHRDSIRKVFRPWFAVPNRIDEIAKFAFTALRNGDAETWKAHWDLLRSVLGQSQCNVAMERLLRAQGDELVRCSIEGRRLIRASLKTHGNLNPQALPSLFDPVSPMELDELLNDDTLTPASLAYVAHAVRCKGASEMRQGVKAFLKNASADSLGEYARLAFKNLEQGGGLARELFAMDSHGNAPYLDRLLGLDAKYLMPRDWLWFAKVHELCANGQQIKSTMLQKQRLSKLLFAVYKAKDSLQLWGVVYKLFTLDFLGKTSERDVWEEIKRFKDLVNSVGVNEKEAIVPKSVDKRLQAAEVLQKVFDTGVADPTEETKSNLTEAFKAFDCDPTVGLDYFCKWLDFDKDIGDYPTKLNRFATIFSVFFPPSEDSLEKCKLALQKWIRLSESNPDSQKKLQTDFFSDKTNLAPKSLEIRLSLIEAFRSEMNPDVVAKFEPVFRKRAAEKRSKKKKKKGSTSRLLLRILLAIGLIVLGMLGMHFLLPVFGSGATTTKTESTSSNLQQDQSKPQPNKILENERKKEESIFSLKWIYSFSKLFQ